MNIRTVWAGTIVAVACAWAAGCSSDEATDDTGAEGNGEGGSPPASGGSAGADDACGGLCDAAGYTGGEEMIFADGTLTECQCSGNEGVALEKSACEAYCAPLGVSAADSLLSGEDKCVCDGTSP